MSIHDKTRCNTAILMAVHNGEKYLAEQIESILNQTYSKFDLIMQDDGSTDCSTKIIDRYCQKDSRIIRLDNIDNDKGAIGNFSALFSYAKDYYENIFFSDQDDIWEATKVERSLKAIQKYTNSPAIVFTNFYLWNSSGTELMYPRKVRYSFERCIVQNIMYGCTMLLNKEMSMLIDEIPVYADNHDYWIALVATLNHASIEYIDEPTLKHRLHMDNVTTRADTRTIKAKLKILFQDPFMNRYITNRFVLWTSIYNGLYKRYGSSELKNLKKLLNSKGIIDALTCIKCGFKGHSIQCTFKFFLTVALRNRPE